jgi:hypothetical protein
MFRWIKGSIVFLAAAVLAQAADQTLLNLVMPEAKMLTGINIEQAKSTPFGQFLLSQMQSTGTELEKFIFATGFDPRQDLHEILIASADPAKKNQTLILVRASFNTPVLLGLAKQQGATIQNYKGIDVIIAPQRAKQAIGAWVAFLDNSVAILGDPGSVKLAIDRRNGGTGLDPQLLARVHELSNLYDLWSVSLVPLPQLAGKVPDERLSGAMKGDVLRSIQETSGGVKFGSEIEITAQAVTRSEKDAAALADVVRFLAGLVQLNRPDAKITAPASLLQSLDLRAEGNVMQLSMRIPESEVERFILSAKAANQASRKSRPVVRREPKTPRDTGITIHSSEMGTVVVPPPKYK